MSSFGKTASNSPRFAVECMQGFACSDDAGKPENRNNAAIAPAVERTLGKGEVACSNHAGSTIFPRQTVLKHARTSVLLLVNKPACMLKNAVAR